MQERKRLFSWFDIAVVAVVLLAAFAWFFVINRAPDVAPTFEGSQAVFYVEVTNLTPEQVASVQVGDWLQEGSQHIPIGRVADIETRPHVVRVEDAATQTISWEEVEDRLAMILTVETEVVETERDILAEGQFAIKGGLLFSFTGPGYGFTQAVVLGWARGA